MVQMTLVAYFSASGVTAKVAKQVAAAAGSDLFEIEPEVRYTKEDLDWRDKKSRSSVEMNDKTYRPAMAKHELDIAQYDTVFVGFPIWWYVAPTIVNTFLESCDLGCKRIVLFATSGGSGWGNTVQELKPSAPGAEIIEGKLLNRASEKEIGEWVASVSR